MSDQLTQHRAAYMAVMAAMPGSQHISHEEIQDADWERPEVSMPDVTLFSALGCQTCGEPPHVVGLTQKCRDRHEVCHCGARYDQPKNPGCRRRKHPKSQETK